MNQSISTGFVKLDALLPITPGFHLIGARPHTGVTSILLQMAYHIAKTDTPVIFIDLTHSSKELCARLISQRLNLSPSAKQRFTPTEIMEGAALKSTIVNQIRQLIQEKKMLMLLHPSKPISCQQLAKLLDEYHTKCEKTPVIMINPLNALIDTDEQEPLTKALLSVSGWQMLHQHIPVITRCYIKETFQRHINVSAFGFNFDITDTANSITGIQLQTLCTKEFYGTRDEEGDLHAVPLRKQLQIAQNATNAKTRHLRAETIKGPYPGAIVDLDYDTTYLSVTEP